MLEKVRNYKYDNLKFLMIFFVVFGHCLELIEGTISHSLWAIIYTFTMPVFVYISGYFGKFKKENIIKYCWIYVVCQAIYCLLDKYIFQIDVNFFKPNWLLWYMFALIVWTLSIKIVHTENEKKGLIIVTIAFIISLIAGLFDFIGYDFSLSRIITFFPYFLLGYYTKNAKLKFFNIKNEDGKYNKYLLIFWSIIALVSFIYFWNIKGVLQSNWLYGALSYNMGGYTPVFKMMWILVSLFEIFFLDNFMINKKIPVVSKIGANTLYIYLIHGIIIKYFRYKENIFVFSEIENLILAVIVTLTIILIFGCVSYKKKR